MKVPAAGCIKKPGDPEFGSSNLKTEPTGTSETVAITLLLPAAPEIAGWLESSAAPQAANPTTTAPAALTLKTSRLANL
jgi:hypothetical protein